MSKRKVACALLGIALAIPAHAYVFDEQGIDRRHIVKRSGPDGYMYAPIGPITRVREVPVDPGSTLSSATKRWIIQGSGFLVSPCLVLTNDHVVFDEGASRNPSTFDQVKVHFQAGEKGEPNYIEATGQPVLTLQSRGEEARFDTALVRLKPDDHGKCAGEYVGWMELGGLDYMDPKGCWPELIGFPADRDSSFAWSDGPRGVIKTHVMGSWIIEHQDGTKFGNSGSPMVCMDEQGWPTAIGVAEAFQTPSKDRKELKTEAQKQDYFNKVYPRAGGGRMNLAIDMWFIRPLIAPLILLDLFAHPGAKNVARMPLACWDDTPPRMAGPNRSW